MDTITSLDEETYGYNHAIDEHRRQRRNSNCYTTAITIPCLSFKLFFQIFSFERPLLPFEFIKIVFILLAT
jgi:hypothetical protein